MSVDFEARVDAIPADWPRPGSIDLLVHDRPHDSARMEWWYVNSHVKSNNGRAYSMFAAFFRVDVTAAGETERRFTHFLTWAIVDETSRRYYPCTLLDRRSPSIALDDIANGKGPRDPRLSRALKEVLERKAVPLPDRLLSADATVSLDSLNLDFDGNTFVKHPDGSYQVDLSDARSGIACRLNFTLEKPVVRHGDDGVVRGLGGQDMFYYFSPRCRVSGALEIDGATTAVTGDGWYDHEFGEHEGSDTGRDTTVAWNWISAQLDNGCEISAYDLIDKTDRTVSHGRWVIIVDATGARHAHTDFSFETLDAWTSTKTFNEYPTRYLLTVPGAGISLDITAAFPEQEMITLIAPPGFWEGLTKITGTWAGQAVTGRGFIERSGLSHVDTTDDFFAAVGRETRRAIDTLLPERPSHAQAIALIGGPGLEHYVDGISLDQYAKTVLQPIREIIFRGGKAWRSYGILSCMDLVGGNSQPFANWLALPELLHVGSLIIDDVQDDSDVRRGGPACHKTHGVSLAINAGCASYFLAQIPVGQSSLDDSMRARIYEAYFEAVRAAHAGQAFDIDGLSSLMPAVVESGDGAMLEKRVIGVHRLKSAAPAGALARMAAAIGGGTQEQARALGRLFESFGLAFQIIDDVLNLRGFDENRKNRGEDITAGKITAPVAKAMGRLSREDRFRLWAIVASQPRDRAVIGDAVRLVDGCGALDACEADARELVESAWAALDPMIPDSQYKVRLRAFGWFVLDRHY